MSCERSGEMAGDEAGERAGERAGRLDWEPAGHADISR